MANENRFGKAIPRAVKSRARQAFSATPSSLLYESSRVARQQYTRGALGAIPGAKQLAGVFQQGGVSAFLNLAGGKGYERTWHAVERYTRSSGVGKTLVSQFLRELGPIGQLLGAIVGHDTGGRGSLPSDLRYALDFVRAFSDRTDVINALQRILEGRGAKVTWLSRDGDTGMTHVPRGSGAGDVMREIESAIRRADDAKDPRPASTAPPPAAGGGRGRGGRGGQGGRGGRGGQGGGGAAEPPSGGDDGRVPVDVDGETRRLPPDHPLVTGAMIETPDSSNVYSFGFDNNTHSLFVRFKDQPPKEGQTIGGIRIKSVFGASGRGRPHRPGPLYLYHHVPAKLFLAFIDASSKGSWVWDHLRIRGTLSGHRFDYALVGVQGAYVPRKATLTEQGESYIPRTVFTDRGRSLSSSLPEQLVRPLRPVYPDSGRSGLGRPPNDGRGGLGGGRGRGRR